MKRFICLAVLMLNPTVAVGDVSINVVDEQGSPVEKFEAMYHTADEGCGQWESGENGKASLGLFTPKSSAIDVLVRSDDFPPLTVSFVGDALQKMLRSESTIVLHRGREVQLRLVVSEDVTFPEELLPQLFFPEYAWLVRAMWRPANLQYGTPDFNMLNVKPVGEGVFKFRLSPKPRNFHIAIQHPGWLQFCDLGLFTIEDFKDEILEIEVPKPATLEANLNFGERASSQLDFDKIRYDLMWQLPGMGNSYVSVASADMPIDGLFSISDLGPGSYHLRLQTTPREVSEADDGMAIHPGRFMDQRKFELEPNQTKKVDFEFVPFNQKAFQGDGTARIKVLGPDGLPAKRRTIKVTYHDGHYGSLTVHEGSILGNGITVLEGISRKAAKGNPYGPYTVEVDGEWLGFFGFDASQSMQDFEFRLVPRQGDLAPDISMVEVKTGKTRQLKELKGKIVLLEFWATWCGPCQPEMNKLNELDQSHREIWNDQVAIVPLSVDNSTDLVVQHIEQRGWTGLNHYLSARNESGGLSPAEEAYVVRGVPTTLLVDRNGRIAWRGHPSDNRDGYDMGERIDRLLSGRSIGQTWYSYLMNLRILGAFAVIVLVAIVGVVVYRSCICRKVT